jgi:putative flavoprotein involved in K+ transport
MKHYYDVIVIGAGQAGLAVGHFLSQSDQSFVLLDAQEEVGDNWKKRYQSLVLFTPRQFCSLPGMPFPGDPSGHPTKAEVVEYLKAYAERFQLPIHFRTRVLSLKQIGDAFIIFTNHGSYYTKKVIVATGPFQVPKIPSFAYDLPDDIFQIHTADYQGVSQLQRGEVLVVGAGNSGAQIAVELSKTHKTYLSVGRPILFRPAHILGKSIFWYLDRFGMLQADEKTKRGSWLKNSKEWIYGYALKEKIAKREILVKPRTISTIGHHVAFADSTTLSVPNIIWATGYKTDFSWIHIPGALNRSGFPIHDKGVSVIPNLYFIGLRWLSCQGSSLLGWVGRDAERLSKLIIDNKHTGLFRKRSAL